MQFLFPVQILSLGHFVQCPGQSLQVRISQSPGGEDSLDGHPARSPGAAAVPQHSPPPEVSCLQPPLLSGLGLCRSLDLSVLIGHRYHEPSLWGPGNQVSNPRLAGLLCKVGEAVNW